MSTPAEATAAALGQRQCTRCGMSGLQVEFRFCPGCGGSFAPEQHQHPHPAQQQQHAYQPVLQQHQQQQPYEQQHVVGHRQQQQPVPFRPQPSPEEQMQQEEWKEAQQHLQPHSRQPAPAPHELQQYPQQASAFPSEWHSADGTLTRREGPTSREWMYRSPDGREFEHAVQEWGPGHQMATYKARRTSFSGATPEEQQQLRDEVDRQLESLRQSLRTTFSRRCAPPEPGRWELFDRGLDCMRQAMDTALANPGDRDALGLFDRDIHRLQREMWADMRNCFPDMHSLHDDVWRDMDSHMSQIRNIFHLPTMEWDRPMLAHR